MVFWKNSAVGAWLLRFLLSARGTARFHAPEASTASIPAEGQELGERQVKANAGMSW